MTQTSLVPFAPFVLHTGTDGDSVLDSFAAPIPQLLYPLPGDVRGTFAGLLDTLQALRPLHVPVPALTVPSGMVYGQWLTPLVGGHVGVALLHVDAQGRSLVLEWTVTTAGMVSVLTGHPESEAALTRGALRPEQFAWALHRPVFSLLTREGPALPPQPELGAQEFTGTPRAAELIWSDQRLLEPGDTPLGQTPYGLLRGSLGLGSGLRMPERDPFGPMFGSHLSEDGELSEEPVTAHDPATFSRLLTHGAVHGSVRLIARPGHQIDPRCMG